MVRLLAATLAPSWDTQSSRLRAGGSLEGESRADLVIYCLLNWPLQVAHLFPMWLFVLQSHL